MTTRVSPGNEIVLLRKEVWFRTSGNRDKPRSAVIPVIPDTLFGRLYWKHINSKTKYMIKTTNSI